MRASHLAAALRLSGISKRRSGQAALDGVSLDVAARASCVLLAFLLFQRQFVASFMRDGIR